MLKECVVNQVPSYGPNELLIKGTHVAQNPTDSKYVHFGFAKPGLIVSCVHGGLEVKEGIRGAFSEYIIQDASSSIALESAATTPLASITAREIRSQCLSLGR